MTLNGVMAITFRYFTEFGKHITTSICGGFMHESIVFCSVVHVRCRCEESFRLLSHLLLSFLCTFIYICTWNDTFVFS